MGHYTTAPHALEGWRTRQIAGIKDLPKAVQLKTNHRRTHPRRNFRLVANGPISGHGAYARHARY
jgi:hypothetical protein